MTQCIICSLNEALYKCPKCRIQYCSVKCYKTHTEQNCTPIPKESVETKKYEYVTEDTVPREKLRLLDNCDELKFLLNNRHLRDVLLEIDNTKTANVMMEKAMKEPIFVEFADACIKTIQNELKKSD